MTLAPRLISLIALALACVGVLAQTAEKVLSPQRTSNEVNAGAPTKPTRPTKDANGPDRTAMKATAKAKSTSSPDPIAILAVVVNGLVLCVIAWQATLSRNQLREFQRSTRVSLTFDLLVSTHRIELQEKMLAALPFDYTKSKPKLSPDQLNEIWDNHEIRNNIRLYLGYIELLCNGVSHGALDEKILRDQLRSVIVELYFFYEDYIDKLRQEANRPGLYEKLESTARGWTPQ